jgi:hypothetical protein
VIQHGTVVSVVVFARLGFVLAALLIASACSSGGEPTSAGAPQMTLTFDGKDVPLANPPNCISSGKNMMVSAAVPATSGKVIVDFSVTELVVHTVSIHGVDGDEKYFWETTSTAGEPMTATKDGTKYTVRGNIHQIKDYHVKNSIEITANCPAPRELRLPSTVQKGSNSQSG